MNGQACIAPVDELINDIVAVLKWLTDDALQTP
jgi:hypothetical protein